MLRVRSYSYFQESAGDRGLRSRIYPRALSCHWAFRPIPSQVPLRSFGGLGVLYRSNVHAAGTQFYCAKESTPGIFLCSKDDFHRSLTMNIPMGPKLDPTGLTDRCKKNDARERTNVYPDLTVWSLSGSRASAHSSRCPLSDSRASARLL